MMYARQGLLDEVEAGLYRVGASDLSAHSPVETEDALVVLDRVEAKLGALKARLSRKYEVEQEWARRGALHPGAVIATLRRVPSRSCKRAFTLSRQLEELLALLAALARGSVSLQHRDRILRVDNRRVHERFVEDHETFVEWAETMDWATFELHLVMWSHMADPDGPDPGHDDRGLDLSETWGGEFVLTGTMGAVQGTVFGTELKRQYDLLFKADWAEAKERLGRDPIDAELGRTPRQRRLDALLVMAERSATGPEAGRKGAILACLLLGPDAARWLCEFTTGTRIRPGQAAPHVDDLLFETFLFGAGMKDVSVSPQRLFLEALRRAAQALGRQCFHEFCDRPAADCQVDHRKPYSKGGATAIWNSQPGCAPHNGRKGNKDPIDGPAP
jgi:hypothetical protein